MFAITRKKRLAIIGCIVVLFLVAARIVYINATASNYKNETYQMGEWIALDGAFIQKSGENTDGYFVKVNDAKLLSYNEYIELYGIDKRDKVDGLDKKTVVSLEVSIRNEDNQDGYLNIFSFDLIPESKNNYLIRDADLWSTSEDNISSGEGELNTALGLVENSEYTTRIPYAINDGTENYERHQEELAQTEYEWVISNAPVRKVVKIIPS